MLLRLRKYKYSQAKMEVLKCDQIIELRIKKKNVTSSFGRVTKKLKNIMTLVSSLFEVWHFQEA